MKQLHGRYRHRKIPLPNVSGYTQFGHFGFGALQWWYHNNVGFHVIFRLA